jgi:hypothetical protein
MQPYRVGCEEICPHGGEAEIFAIETFGSTGRGYVVELGMQSLHEDI